MLNPESITGIDISSDSLDVARQTHQDPRLRFALASNFQPSADIDLAFTNGVFHHIPPAERSGTLQFIYRALRPGGLFAFWENNPWNPGTRYVMSRVPFDRDAIMVWPHAFRRLLRKSRFEVISTDYQFIFPRFLASLRPLEPMLAGVPFGAQYLILARKRGQ
jgi:SAM-dependent methyltransferase